MIGTLTYSPVGASYGAADPFAVVPSHGHYGPTGAFFGQPSMRPVPGAMPPGAMPSAPLTPRQARRQMLQQYIDSQVAAAVAARMPVPAGTSSADAPILSGDEIGENPADVVPATDDALPQPKKMKIPPLAIAGGVAAIAALLYFGTK